MIKPLLMSAVIAAALTTPVLAESTDAATTAASEELTKVLTDLSGTRMMISCRPDDCKVSSQLNGADTWARVEFTEGGEQQYFALITKYNQKGFN
jgi:hypothetical protein